MPCVALLAHSSIFRASSQLTSPGHRPVQAHVQAKARERLKTSVGSITEGLGRWHSGARPCNVVSALSPPGAVENNLCPRLRMPWQCSMPGADRQSGRCIGRRRCAHVSICLHCFSTLITRHTSRDALAATVSKRKPVNGSRRLWD